MTVYTCLNKLVCFGDSCTLFILLYNMHSSSCIYKLTYTCVYVSICWRTIPTSSCIIITLQMIRPEQQLCSTLNRTRAVWNVKQTQVQWDGCQVRVVLGLTGSVQICVADSNFPAVYTVAPSIPPCLFCNQCWVDLLQNICWKL